MSLLPFHAFCPETAVRETRSLKIFEGNVDLPAGDYGFFEWYCSELKNECDCRRVLLEVRSPDLQGSLVSISYGFDADGKMPGPFIDPMRPRSEFAEALLQMAEDLLFSDPEYVARLERHYELMKAEVAREPGRRRSMVVPDVAARIAEKRAIRKQRRTWEKRRR